MSVWQTGQQGGQWMWPVRIKKTSAQKPEGSGAARPVATRKLRSAEVFRAFPVFVEARVSPVSRERRRRGRVLAIQHKLETL